MISVLKTRETPPVRPVPGARIVQLRTGLSALGRDPITGGTPDLLIVLKGGAGTLVELAFAFRKPIPTFFVQSARHLKNELQNHDLGDDIKTALTDYHMGDQNDVETRARNLKDRLVARLAKAQDEKTVGNNSADIAHEVLDTALWGYIDTDIEAETSFEGLPTQQIGERSFKREFNEAIEKLSALKEDTPFPIN